MGALRVLVVEDDPDAREQAMEVLRVEGFDVWGASSFDAAIDVLRGAAPTVVVTDLHLGPGPSGVDLAKHVRRTPATREVGLVAMSSAVEPEWEVMRWFDAYLRKPFDADLLARVVRSIGAVSSRTATSEVEPQRGKGRT